MSISWTEDNSRYDAKTWPSAVTFIINTTEHEAGGLTLILYLRINKVRYKISLPRFLKYHYSPQGVLCSTVDWMFGMQIDKWRAGEVVSLAQKSNFKRTLQLLELFGGHQALYKVLLISS